MNTPTLRSCRNSGQLPVELVTVTVSLICPFVHGRFEFPVSPAVEGARAVVATAPLPLTRRHVIGRRPVRGFHTTFLDCFEVDALRGRTLDLRCQTPGCR